MITDDVTKPGRTSDQNKDFPIKFVLSPLVMTACLKLPKFLALSFYIMS